MRLRTLWDSVKIADEVRSLFNEEAHTSLQRALRDFVALVDDKVPWALIGGLAVGYHADPRGTNDIDILLSDEDAVHTVISLASERFKRSRDHWMTHKSTGVEVEILTASFLKVEPAVVRTVLSNSVVVNGVRLADVGGLIAMKLQRWTLQDRADVEKLVKMHGKPDLSKFGLSPSLTARFDQFIQEQGL